MSPSLRAPSQPAVAGTFAYTKHFSLTTTSSMPSSRSSPASRFASSNCSLLLGHAESLPSSLGVLTAKEIVRLKRAGMRKVVYPAEK